MIDAPIALAFGTGMAAAFNPCGFAMLPAYLSYFLGLNDEELDSSGRVLRALKVGLTVSLGFMVVFGFIGLVIVKLFEAYDGKLPYVTMVMGAGIAALGVAMMFGYQPSVALPKLQKGTSSRELSSMFLFGVSYAISSLSCTIGVFVAQVGFLSAERGFTSRFAVFLAYGAGMALVLMFLTMAIALARHGIVRRMKGVLPYLNRIAGALLIVAGLFLVYFGWYEARVLGLLSGGDPGGPGRAVLSWQSSVQGWIADTGATRIGIVLAGAIAVVILITFATRRPDRAS